MFAKELQRHSQEKTVPNIKRFAFRSVWFYLAGLQPSPPLPTWWSDPLLVVPSPLSDQEEMRDLDADHDQDDVDDDEEDMVVLAA